MDWWSYRRINFAMWMCLVLLFRAVHNARPQQRPSRPTKSRSDEQRLLNDLFRGYDRSVRPRYNSSETVQVVVRLSLQQLNDLDEKRQILKMSGWLTAEWADDFLKWDPEDYGGLTSVVVEPTRLWTPKLAIGNSANKLFDADHYKRFWITVRSKGQARWQPGGVFAIACALDMNYYPFDDQKCRMEVETWVYTSDKVNLSTSYTEIGMDNYIPHGEWTVIKTEVSSVNKVYKYYLTESFPEVYFTVYIRRKYTFYFMYILLPCLMLSGVLLMIFVLPADSGEKVSLGVSILVAISVFLLLVAGNVPDTSDAIPIIAIYLTYFMMATTMSVALSVFVVRIHYKSPERQAPEWVRSLIFNWIAKLVCMKHHHQWAAVAYGRKNRASLNRDITWSETMAEDMKSRGNSHATVTSSEAMESIELLHQRRRLHSDEYNAEQGMPRQRSSRQHVTDLRQSDDREWMTSRGPVVVDEWRKIAEVLDRFFFWTFVVFLIVPTATILGIVRLFKPQL